MIPGVILLCSCKQDYPAKHNASASTPGEFAHTIQLKEKRTYENGEAMKTVKLGIIGKVQGVWFRASAKDKALSLELKGKVWNEPNGDVGIIVQGHEEKVAQFIEWCKEGPRMAEVKEVIVKEISDPEVYADFKITRS